MTEIAHNAFTENLAAGEFVAINSAGTPVGRASSREALEHAHADEGVTIMSAAELAALDANKEAENFLLNATVHIGAVVAQGAPEPAAASTPAVDGSAFDHDKDGHVGGSRPKKAAKPKASKPKASK